MKRIYLIISACFLSLLLLCSCVKEKSRPSDSASEPTVEEQKGNNDYEDPGIDPELAGRDLKDGDEITYAPEKEAVLGAMIMAADDLWNEGKFEDPASFKDGFKSPLPPEGMEKPDLKDIDGIKVFYSTKDGEKYIGQFPFTFDGEEWTMVAEYSMEKGSFTVPGNVYFIKGSL